MSTGKNSKEQAYLFDLYVASDWSERFAQLVDEHVKLPEKGRVLYVGAGTGGHALKLLERISSDKVTLVGVDESEERLELARAKAAAAKMSEQTEFRRVQLEELGFEDNSFDFVIGDASLIRPERLPEMLAEINRVTASRGTIALLMSTASSYGEFFSIYWEALYNSELDRYGASIENLIEELPTVSDVEMLAAENDLTSIESHTRREEFNYASGGEFLSAPLVSNFLLQDWLEALPDEPARNQVTQEIKRIIDDERQGADFTMSIKATVVIAHKAAR